MLTEGARRSHEARESALAEARGGVPGPGDVREPKDSRKATVAMAVLWIPCAVVWATSDTNDWGIRVIWLVASAVWIGRGFLAGLSLYREWRSGSAGQPQPQPDPPA